MGNLVAVQKRVVLNLVQAGVIVPLPVDHAVGRDHRVFLVDILQKQKIGRQGHIGRFQNQHGQIVGAHVAHIPAFNGVIGPDEEGGLKHTQRPGVAAEQPFIGIVTQGRLVVTVHDDHGGFVHLLVVVDQLLQGFVRERHEG